MEQSREPGIRPLGRAPTVDRAATRRCFVRLQDAALDE
ncbi:hypothetical protein GLA29479_696 [Lysobacter antibioticus]|nr:hypothetical protein GLA29479_696 [Lysobacter antibioticus]